MKQKQEGRQVWGFLTFPRNRLLRAPGGWHCDKMQQLNGPGKWRWQHLKGSRQAQTRRLGGSFGSPAAPTLRGEGHNASKEGSIEVVVWYGDLGEDRCDLRNTAGDLCSSLFTSHTSVDSSMTLQLLCSALQTLRSPLALGLVLDLLQESLLKRQ